MTTTLLFVELLIAGIQAAAWLFLLMLSVFGYQWLVGLSVQFLSEWQTLIAIIVLSFVYVFGILIDRLGDILFVKWDWAIGKKMFPNPPYTFAVIRYRLSKENEYLHQQLEYTRSRLRIARGSVVNFALITIFAEIFLFRWVSGFPIYASLSVFIAVSGSLLTFLAVFTWYRLSRSYYGLIRANSRPAPIFKRQRKVARQTKSH